MQPHKVLSGAPGTHTYIAEWLALVGCRSRLGTLSRAAETQSMLPLEAAIH